MTSMSNPQAARNLAQLTTQPAQCNPGCLSSTGSGPAQPCPCTHQQSHINVWLALSGLKQEHREGALQRWHFLCLLSCSAALKYICIQWGMCLCCLMSKKLMANTSISTCPMVSQKQEEMKEEYSTKYVQMNTFVKTSNMALCLMSKEIVSVFKDQYFKRYIQKHAVKCNNIKKCFMKTE